MFDQRLLNLRKAGYGNIKIDAIARSLTDEALDAIGETETPSEAVQVMNEFLATAKVTVDEIDDKEE